MSQLLNIKKLNEIIEENFETNNNISKVGLNNEKNNTIFENSEQKALKNTNTINYNCNYNECQFETKLMCIQKIFNGLLGKWRMCRTLISRHPMTLPSGTVEGAAIFTPLNKNELHYRESGQFITDSDKRFAIQSDYTYVFHEQTAKLAKYSAQNQEKMDFLYNLEIANTSANEYLIARGQLLCGSDNYAATYEFDGVVDFNKFSLTYVVKGPKKDYTSVTLFERVLAE